MLYRSMLRVAAVALGLGLAGGVLLPMPGFAQSSMTVEVGGLKINVIGSGSQEIGPSGDGYRIALNGLVAEISPRQVRVNGQVFDIAGAREVTVDASGDAYRITADGRVVYQLNPVEALTIRANSGDMLALALLADRMFDGDGIAQDPVRAAQMLRQAAEAGVTGAQSALAHRLFGGDQMAENAQEARMWAQRAADNGHSAAKGYMMIRGLGGPADAQGGLALMQAAIDDGHVNTMIRLGFIYATGEGLPQDYARALELNRMAAEAGDITGTRNMAIIGAESGFTVLSVDEVLALLDELDRDGHPDAQAIRQMVEERRAALQAQPAPQPQPVPNTNTTPPPLPEEPRYWYAADGNPAGPVTRSEFLRLRDAGVIAAGTLVWENGLANWIPADQLALFRE